jgi:phosphoglycolate phosphatase
VTTRLVLFDIDGTLLSTGNRVHGRAIVQACTELTGHDITKHFGVIDSGGRTDRYIVSELLRRCGVEGHEIDELFSRISARSVELTGAGLREQDPGWALPGAQDLIDKLLSADVAIGLVTGNLPEIARIKLACAGLWEPFASQTPLITGFGDLSENRNDLSAAAFAQAQREINANLLPTNVIVVGDTPRDVECAHAIGARCLGVTTGRYNSDDLDNAGSEMVVSSLTEVIFENLWTST